MKNVIAFVLIIIAGTYGIGSAQNDKAASSEKTSWHKIGETTISFMAEKYEIVLLEADKFGYIKFKLWMHLLYLWTLKCILKAEKTIHRC